MHFLTGQRAVANFFLRMQSLVALYVPRQLWLKGGKGIGGTMMQFIQFLAISTGLIAVPTTAFASDWRYLPSGTGGVVVTVDVESVRELPAIQIQRPFPVRQIWVSMDFSKDRTVTYRENRQLHRFNCTAETSMVASNVTYGPDGRVLQSRSVEDYDFRYEPETPDTIGYAIMEFVCGRANLP